MFKTNCKHAKILSLTVVIRCLSLQTFFNTDFLLIAMESNDITTVYLTDSDSRDVRLNHISGYPSLNGQFAEIAINQYTNGQTQLYKITFGKTSHLPSSFQLGNISSTGRSGIDFACLCWSHKLSGTDKRKRDSSWRFVGRNLYSHHNSTHHSVCPSLYRHKSSRPRFHHHLLQQRLNKRGYKTSLSLK